MPGRFRFVFPSILAIALVLLGTAFWRPQTAQQLTTLSVSLALLAYLPWVIDTGFRRSITGIVLGALLGLPVAACFDFWPIEIIFVAIGWANGIAAGRPLTAPTDNPLSFDFSLAFMFSLMFLFASIFYILQLQTKTLTRLESDAVLVDRSFGTLLPRNAKIVIAINSKGDYVLGKKTTDDYAVAVTFLKQNIDVLLNAGTAPEEISIIGVTPNPLHQNKIWLLREAFDNVRGKELMVSFQSEFPGK